MKGLVLSTITAALFLSVTAAAQTDNGRSNIEKLCGCFSVNFRYAETFSPDENYKFHEREDMNAMELVLPIEKNDREIIMQHLLIINDSTIIKHWREDWTYESPVIYTYEGDKKWVRKELSADEVKGKWTQTVWEVSDEPRYQGISSWINNDGKTYWESTSYTPLPRREYTQRSDYNILKRTNRIVVSDDKYVHVQDNEKIMRENGKDKLIVEEKGFNTYYRQEDGECAKAREWWQKNKSFWTVVRNEWTNYMKRASTVTMKTKVDDKMLNEHLTSLWREWSLHKVKDEELNAKVKAVIGRFL